MNRKMFSENAAGFMLAVLFVAIFFQADNAYARNADLSNWTKNISESSLDTEPRDPDYAPEIAVVGSIVHVMWVTRNIDGADHKLYYRRSIDKGATWEPKKLLFTSTEGNNFFQSSMNSPTYRKMAVDGNNVHIFQNFYRGNWYGVMTYFRSTDNGASFEPVRDVVTADGAHGISDIYASASGGKVTVGYTNRRNWEVADSVNVLISNDNGNSFSNRQADFFWKESSKPKNTSPTIMDMLRMDDKIYLLYSSGYYYYGLNWAYLYFAASTDGGDTWTINTISVPSQNGEHKTVGGQDVHYVPKIAAVGDYVHVVWTGFDHEDTRSLFYSGSTDSGVTFMPAVNMSKPDLSSSRNPRWGSETIAAKGDYVYIVFVAGDHAYDWVASSNTQVHLKRSADNGATFHGLQTLCAATDVPYVGSGWWPVVQTDPFESTGTKVHVLWNPSTYVYSTEGGASFRNPVMVSPHFSASGLSKPQMALGNDGAVHWVSEGSITWYSTGVFGDSDIFYRNYKPVIAPTPPTANQALKFVSKRNSGDGTGDERFDNMQIPASPDVNFTTAMTVDAWIKPNRDLNTEGFFVYKAEPGAGGSWGSYMLGQWRDGRADARIATTTGGYVLVGGDSLPNHEWSHVAMTYDANAGTDNFKLYVNGQLAGATTATGNLKTQKGILFVGAADSSYRYYTDIIVDELRLWDKALTPDEIMVNTKSELTGSEAGLRAYYHFNGTIRDITGHGNDGILMYKESFETGVGINIAPIITGTPATQVLEGIPYSFVPSAVDDDNNTTLSFSIINKPGWASFNTTTGALSGTPDGGNIGITSGIVISVSDGITTVSLPSFNLKVAGTASLTGKVLISVAGHVDLPALSAIVIIDETGEQTTVDSSGAFAFTGLGSKTYTVRARVAGLADRVNTFTLAPNQDLQAGNIKMVAGEFTQEDLARVEAAKNAIIAQKENTIKNMFTAEDVQQAVDEAVSKYDVDGDGLLGLEEAIRILQTAAGIGSEQGK